MQFPGVSWQQHRNNYTIVINEKKVEGLVPVNSQIICRLNVRITVVQVERKVQCVYCSLLGEEIYSSHGAQCVFEYII